MELSSINFYAQPFSLADHLRHPFSQRYSNKAQEQRTQVLKLHFKVASVAFSIFAGVAAAALVGKIVGALLCATAFYVVTGLIKSRMPESIKSSANKTGSVSEKSFKPQQESADELSMGVLPFYHQVFKPILDTIFHPPSNTSLFYIQPKTAPFTEWLQKEYQGVDCPAFINLNHLRKAHPAVNKGLFVNIRSDGDDTFRSIGAGLILQACSDHDPVIAVNQLFAQFEAIGQQLVDESKSISEKIDAMYAKVEKFQDKSTASTSLYLHVADLREFKNQAIIKSQIGQLQYLMTELRYVINHHLKYKTSEDTRIKLLNLMQDEEFDKTLISFLRKTSALNTVLNADKMLHLNVPSFESLIQKANARQSEEENLQGSLVDIFSLSELFEQPINFFHCETFFEIESYVGNQFGEDFKEGKNQLLILNSLHHSNLVLM